MNFSKQQNDFFDFCANDTSSAVLMAVAGAGKTTAIIEAIANHLKGTSVVLAYNKKIGDEISEKLKKRGITWQKAEAGTVHSFGFRALSKTFKLGKDAVQADKVENLFARSYNELDVVWPYSHTVAKLVSLAKQRAIGILTPIGQMKEWVDIWDHFDILGDVDDDKEIPQTEIIEAAISLLRKSNNVTNVIDFDDMVYLPVLHKVKFWQYDNVLVDEAQDTNPARRALVACLVKNSGRVIAVGDPHQAIYGFTGADNDSLDLIEKRFNAKRLPLSITFRCPKSVVKFANQWVNHIEAADTAPEGSVSKISESALMVRKDLTGESAILCRNTAPLVSLAFTFIRNKVPCKVEGRDIGANLKKLALRWKIKTINALEDKLVAFLKKEKAKDGKNIQTVEDQVETLKVIIDQCRTDNKMMIADVVAFIDSLFADNVNGILVLSTIHKSKGREWKNVFWYDRSGTCPSKYAKQPWQMEQEMNLMYVAATRAMENLIEVAR